MKDAQRTLSDLRTECESLRQITVSLQQNLQLERSRTESLENAVNAHARRLPEFEASITVNRKSIAQLARTRKQADGELGASILSSEQSTHEVLEAHTASMFRQAKRIDHVVDTLARYPSYTLLHSLIQDHTHCDDADPVVPVDANHDGVDVLAADNGC